MGGENAFWSPVAIGLSLLVSLCPRAKTLTRASQFCFFPPLGDTTRLQRAGLAISFPPDGLGCDKTTDREALIVSPDAGIVKNRILGAYFRMATPTLTVRRWWSS